MIRPLVMGKMDRKNILIFFDSGSPENLISEETYFKYFIHDKLYKKTMCSLPLQDIQGKVMTIVGYTVINFSIGNINFNEEFAVVRNLTLIGQLLCGHPFMEKNDIVLYPRQREISITRQIFPYIRNYSNSDKRTNFHCHKPLDFKDCHTENPGKVEGQLNEMLKKNKVVPISCSHKITLLPQHTAVIKCKLKSGLNGKSCITLPEFCNVNGLSYQSSVHTIERNTLFVHIANDRSGPLELHKGTQIGSVETYNHDFRIEEELPQDLKGVVGTLNPVDLVDRRSKIGTQINKLDYPSYFHRLVELLVKYDDAIALKGDRLGKTNVIKHHINIPPGTPPVFIPAYRIPVSQKEKINQSINEMLDQQIISKSTSPWSSPLLLVPKRDNTFRVVVDFRKINKVTLPDPYPVPSLRDLISSIGENQVFTTLDLLQGFWQVPLDEESKDLTGFSSDLGHFRFERMPFGLRSSPITFCRLVDEVFRGLIGKVCIVYIDDLIILGRSLEEHLANIELVLDRLQKAGLKIKISKCNFMKREVVYLGHTLTQKGIRVNEEKIQAIIKYPTPTTVKEVKSFIGLASFYRRFVKGFADIAAPLTDLLKSDTEFTWGVSQEQAFQDIKSRLTQSPILAFPKFDKEFLLVTDASSLGIGSVLMQYDNLNRLHPLAYFSRKLTAAESNYSVTDREALSVVASLRHFRHILLGHKITVFTDHSAVCEIFKQPQQSGRRARWYLTTADFEVSFKYLPGRQNQVADALSRHVACINTDVLSEDKIKIHQNQDPQLYAIKRYLLTQKQKDESAIPPEFPVSVNDLSVIDDMLIKVTSHTQVDMPDRTTTQIVIPKSLVNEVLKSIHDAKAHPGRDETLRQVRLKYFWKSMNKDVSEHVKSCHNCAVYKGHTKCPSPMQLYPIPQYPFQRVHIDILTNLSETRNGHRHILVLIDSLTRYMEIVPLKTKQAQEVSFKLLDFIWKYSAPEILVSDRGREFCNQLIETICKHFKAKKEESKEEERG